ncbi:hypothetical protein [Pseudonocardia pini]|uniref:hypothetical protein n=1 Tax=Pseudonocardia pini TaxID=2758030 RepID=UPI0015F121FD|nr:hypothetical protein [Pseudonocardia pini]
MQQGDDLSEILTNVAADARPATRVKIANSAETRAFLDIGLQLLRDDLLDHRGPDLLDEHDAGTRLFAGLSQARLIERAAEAAEQEERPAMLTVGMFRDRWRYKSRYTEDLIAYIMRPSRYGETMTMLRAAALTLPEDMRFPDLARYVAEAVMQATMRDPQWSLQTIMWVALPNHPRVQVFLKARYEQWIAAWAETYELLGRRYDLELRPGVTWLDVAEMFNAVTEGARIRGMAMGTVASLSTGDNVVVGSIRAMMPSLFVDTGKLG